MLRHSYIIKSLMIYWFITS